MIRLFKESDFERIVEIAEKAFAGIFEGFSKQIGEDFLRQIRPDYEHCKREQLANAVQNFPERILVEEKNGKILGFLIYQMDKERRLGIIDNNAVDPEYRGRGIARRLYQEAFTIFRQSGLNMATVTTGLDEAHQPARRAYEKVGFSAHLDSITYYKKI